MIDVGSLIQASNAYVHTLVGGNEVAAGIIISGLLGSLAFFAKSFPGDVYRFFVKHATTQMTLNSSTESYYQLLGFLDREGLSENSRFINIGNGLWGHGDSSKQIGYGRQIFWYKKVPLVIEVEKETSDSRSPKEFLHITKFGRDHKLFNDMLEDSETQGSKDETSYYQYNDKYKEFITKQKSRKLSTIILPQKTREELRVILDNFVEKEDWYLKHGIPYQLGIFLYGPPGTGKTTLIRAIADYLGKDVCFVSNAVDMATASLRVNDSVLVAEEIDTLGIINRDEDEPKDKQANTGTSNSVVATTEPEKAKSEETVSRVYGRAALGALLTALDGVISNHGRVIIITSNKEESLDSALMRPGRIDLKLEIGYLTEETFKITLSKFFPEYEIPETIKVKDNVAPVDVQNKIIRGLGAQDLMEMYCDKF